jgi:preprotein translocase subunit YajC
MGKETMRLAIASLAFVSMTFVVPLAPSFAQTAGMQVVDTGGGSVGTVVRVDGDNVVIKTDKHQVALPKTSFTTHEGKLLFGMTQAQLNAETEKSLAEAEASIAAGATVKGTAGAVVGTIDAVDSESVTIKLQSGSLIRVPRSGVAAGGDGVVVGLTAEELEAQVSASATPAQ